MTRFYVLDLGIEGNHMLNYAVMDRGNRTKEGREVVFAVFCREGDADKFCRQMNAWQGPIAERAKS